MSFLSKQTIWRFALKARNFHLLGGLLESTARSTIARYLQFKHRRALFDSKSRGTLAKNRINLLYWSPKHGSNNVGDLVSVYICESVARKYGRSFDEPAPSTTRMMAIGSILDRPNHPTTVWGSGFRTRNATPPFSKLDIRAVRGPKTRDILVRYGIDCPAIYGDPAILLPLFYTPKPTTHRDYVIIPHFTKEHTYKEDPNFLSTRTDDWKTFIDVIASASIVISGSLHGIIFAEAYGIPAALLPDIDSDRFKYEDYYSATGRNIPPFALNPIEALAKSPPLPDLGVLQAQLVDAFPIDIWPARSA